MTKSRSKEKVVRLEKWELRRLAEKYAESRVGREDRFFADPVYMIFYLFLKNKIPPVRILIESDLESSANARQ